MKFSFWHSDHAYSPCPFHAEWSDIAICDGCHDDRDLASVTGVISGGEADSAR